MKSFQFIKTETLGSTGIIRINRPEVYNALNKVAKEEIVKGINEFNNNKDIRSIILTSEGKAFCSGQDLNDRNIKESENSPLDLGHTLETEWIPLIKAIRNSEKLVIGAINGVCAGAGLSVAFACDLIISKPGIKFVSGFSKLGLAPDAGSSFTFVKALGYAKALDFFLFNQALTSEYLLEKEIINQIAEDPMSCATELSSKINQLAPLSVSKIKKNLQFALENSFNESMNNEVQGQRFLGHSNDYQEGLKAFFEKRPPEFQGL